MIARAHRSRRSGDERHRFIATESDGVRRASARDVPAPFPLHGLTAGDRASHRSVYAGKVSGAPFDAPLGWIFPNCPPFARPGASRDFWGGSRDSHLVGRAILGRAFASFHSTRLALRVAFTGLASKAGSAAAAAALLSLECGRRRTPHA